MKNVQIPSDVAFTNSVKAIQTRKGSRRACVSMESGVGWATSITADLAAFIAEQNHVFAGDSYAVLTPYGNAKIAHPDRFEALDDGDQSFLKKAGVDSYKAGYGRDVQNGTGEIACQSPMAYPESPASPACLVP